MKLKLKVRLIDFLIKLLTVKKKRHIMTVEVYKIAKSIFGMYNTSHIAFNLRESSDFLIYYRINTYAIFLCMCNYILVNSLRIHDDRKHLFLTD